MKIHVTAAPTDGQANDAVCALVAKRLGLATSRVWINRGAGSRNKVLGVDGLDFEETIAKLGG